MVVRLSSRVDTTQLIIYEYLLWFEKIACASEVRHWTGWQQQQTLSFLATWFLVQETERGKKWTPAMTLPQMRQGVAVILREAYRCDPMSHLLDACQKRLQRNELARFYHWKQRNRLPPLNLHKRQF